MHNVKGRMTIRKERNSSLPGNPLNPVDGRPNKVIGLWTLESGDDVLLGQLLSAYETSLAVIDGRDAFKTDAIKQNRYTPDGLREAIRDHSVKETAKLKAARNTIDKARDRLAELEKATTLPLPDQSEAASRLRDRVWQQLQRLPEGPARERAILSLAEKNPLVADTLLEMPRELAGIAASTYDEILERKLQATHGDALREMSALREGVDLAHRAVEAADEDLRNEVGVFNASDWQALTKDVQPSAPIHWLRKQGQGWHVLDVTTYTSRPATEEQLQTGREFKSYREYAAANGLPPEPPPRPNIFDTKRA